MRNLKIFFKTVAATLFCILLIVGVYIGVCRVYESMQSRLFDNRRSAVIIGEDYVKFFDIEFIF